MMHDIRRVLRLVRLRLVATRFLSDLTWCVTAGIALALLIRIAQQLLAFQVDWLRVALALTAVSFLAALAWSLLHRPTPAAAARRVDEGADLRDTLSTALAVERDAGPWSRLIVESAGARARTVNVAAAVPIRAPRHWHIPLAAALTALVAWLIVPPFDLLGKRAQANQQRVEKKAVDEAKVQAKSAVDEVAKTLADSGVALDKGEEAKPDGANAKPPEPKSPEEIRRAAVKQLTSMKDKLDELKSQGKSLEAQAMKDNLKQLRSPPPGPASELAAALAKGDFKAAQNALSELSKETAAAGPAGEKARADAAKQLENIQKQLAQIAQSNKALESKLAQMGLDKKLAQDPAALAKALEKLPQLSAEQKQALSNMAQASKSASDSMKSMAQAMAQAAQGMNKDGTSNQGQQGLDQLSQQMSQADLAASELSSVDAALSEAKHQLSALAQGMGQCDNPGLNPGSGQGQQPADGSWKPGDTNRNNGLGRGGPGRADGGGSKEQVADENWEKRKVRSPLGQGPIIGSTVVEGESIRGESRATYQAAVETAAQQANEAIESNAVPREYHDAVKHYFGRLQAKTKAQSSSPTTTPPSSTTTPAATPAADTPKSQSPKADPPKDAPKDTPKSEPPKSEPPK